MCRTAPCISFLAGCDAKSGMTKDGRESSEGKLAEHAAEAHVRLRGEIVFSGDFVVVTVEIEALKHGSFAASNPFSSGRNIE